MAYFCNISLSDYSVISYCEASFFNNSLLLSIIDYAYIYIGVIFFYSSSLRASIGERAFSYYFLGNALAALLILKPMSEAVLVMLKVSFLGSLSSTTLI